LNMARAADPMLPGYLVPARIMVTFSRDMELI
jgi:hypothetical protein